MKYKIEWIEVSILPTKIASFGHGVVFLHDDFCGNNKEKLPVAFIDGYKWLHKVTDMVTVKILKCKYPDRSHENILLTNSEIINEVKESIILFLQDPKHGRITKKVFAWMNG